MVQTIQPNKVSLLELEEQFGLTEASNNRFFYEWREAATELTEMEKLLLDRVKVNFSHLIKSPPMLENTVKMVVLSPLLDLAGFYQEPFHVKSEAEFEVTAQDGDSLIKGRIDVLTLLNRLWLLVIESKRSDFSLTYGIPQVLACMLGNPSPNLPTFGMITNGSDFIFLKLSQQSTTQYGLSRIFSFLNPGNELYEVLPILKRIGTDIQKF